MEWLSSWHLEGFGIMNNGVTEERAKSLCFEYRGYESSDLVELREQDMKYKAGDTVYLKPPEDIVANPCVTSASLTGNEEGFVVEIAGDASNTFRLKYWNCPKMIEAALLCNYYGIEQWYYTYRSPDETINDQGWLEEWMIKSKPSKKIQALNLMKTLRSL
jgi:hypothetical protein